jgi:hypothetical protein
MRANSETRRRSGSATGRGWSAARRGRGLLAAIAARAALVTDGFPALCAAQTEALARQVDVAVAAVDANGVVPLSGWARP